MTTAMPATETDERPAERAAQASVTVIIGSGGADPSAGMLPRSDRAAVGMAVDRFLRGGRARMPAPEADAAVPAGTGDARWALTACTFGEDDQALRYGRAAGAKRLMRIDGPDELDFDVVLIGDAGPGPWGDLLGAILAETHDAALLVDVLDVERRPDRLRVHRDLGRGESEILNVYGPAVLAISSAAPVPLYVSRRRWSRAGLEGLEDHRGESRQHIEAAEHLAAHVGARWEPRRPRTHGAATAPTGSSGAERLDAIFGVAEREAEEDEGAPIIQAEPETCAAHLVRYLAHHGFVEPTGEKERAEREAEAAQPAPAEAQRADTASGAGAGAERADVAGDIPIRLRRGPRPRGERSERRIARRPRPVASNPETQAGKG